MILLTCSKPKDAMTSTGHVPDLADNHVMIQIKEQSFKKKFVDLTSFGKSVFLPSGFKSKFGAVHFSEGAKVGSWISCFTAIFESNLLNCFPSTRRSVACPRVSELDSLTITSKGCSLHI